MKAATSEAWLQLPAGIPATSEALLQLPSSSMSFASTDLTGGMSSHSAQIGAGLQTGIKRGVEPLFDGGRMAAAAFHAATHSMPSSSPLCWVCNQSYMYSKC
eukprot:11534155-Prorocentrum_lima.AAC.1